MSVARRDPDAVVIGSGPNGLVAACVLAGAGMDVLVVEAHPQRAGGAVGSEAATLPGYVHDIGAAFFPWGALSPAFRALPLERHGLHWRWAPIESCHPASDGSVAWIVREPDRHDAAFGGDSRDAERWRRVAEWYRGIEPDVIALLMGPFPSLTPLRRLGVAHAARLGRIFASSGSSPSSVTPYCSAMRWPPPAPKMCSTCPQFEQTWRLMFSTMPSTGSDTFSNILSPLSASARAMSCGVVTMTAPETGTRCASVS